MPFIIGLLIVPVGLYVRRRLPETQTFEEISARVANESRFTPLKLLVTKHLGRLLAGAVFSVLWTVCVYALIIYLPTYYSAPATGLGFTAQHSFLASLVGNVVMVVMCVYAGHLADQFGVQRITTIGTALMLVVPLTALMWLHASKSVTVLLIVHTILCANVALFAGCAPSILPRVYPAPRLSGRRAFDRHGAELQHRGDLLRRIHPGAHDLGHDQGQRAGPGVLGDDGGGRLSAGVAADLPVRALLG